MAASSEMRIALIGATGQLGSDVAKAAARAGVDCVALPREESDVTRPDALARAVAQARPSVVVDTAAFHHVDACEDDPERAYRVNAVGALHAARAARQAGARLVYVSTDYVFDGAKDGLYTEEDAARPLGVYGASKLAGEQAARLADPRALIVRVSGLYGVVPPRGKPANFVDTILAKARKGEALKVVSDQRMTPTYTRDAADAILALLRADAAGLAHVTNAGGPITWHAFATKALELAGVKAEVEPVPASTWPTKATRPANSALDVARLRALGIPTRRWDEALAAYLREKGHPA